MRGAGHARWATRAEHRAPRALQRTSEQTIHTRGYRSVFSAKNFLKAAPRTRVSPAVCAYTADKNDTRTRHHHGSNGSIPYHYHISLSTTIWRVCWRAAKTSPLHTLLRACWTRSSYLLGTGFVGACHYLFWTLWRPYSSLPRARTLLYAASGYPAAARTACHSLPHRPPQNACTFRADTRHSWLMELYAALPATFAYRLPP